MALAASVIIDRVRGILIDPAPGVTWTDPELLDYLSQAMTAVLILKPDAYTLQEFVQLSPGVLQQLPNGAVALLDITQNLDGSVITQVDKDLLDAENRRWRGATQEQNVQNFAADPRSPRRFYVCPPNSGYGQVEILYGSTPPRVTAVTDLIQLQDVYETPLTYFVLAQALMKQTQRQDLSKSQVFMSQFGQLLGVKSQGQIAVAPKVSQTPGK